MKTSKSELDKQIQEIIQQKRDLNLAEEEDKISFKKFRAQIYKLDLRLHELNELKIQELNKQFKEQEQHIIEMQTAALKRQTIKQPKVLKTELANRRPIHKKEKIIIDEPIKHEKVTDKNKNVGNKRQSISKTIITILQNPKIDTEDKAVIAVGLLKPKAHKNDVKKQIKNTIASIKKQKEKRFSQYVWDPETYRVKDTCQTKLI